MRPVVDRLEEEIGDQMVFVSLDAERDGQTAFAAYELRGHPSFVIIDTAGQVRWKGIGEQSFARLEQAARLALGAE